MLTRDNKYVRYGSTIQVDTLCKQQIYTAEENKQKEICLGTRL